MDQFHRGSRLQRIMPVTAGRCAAQQQKLRTNAFALRAWPTAFAFPAKMISYHFS
jgi:hypothetical protein